MKALQGSMKKMRIRLDQDESSFDNLQDGKVINIR
jgi:hypothetical protein